MPDRKTMMTYDETMEYGSQQYADVLDRLAADGYEAQFIQTGGMNAAIQVDLPDGGHLLITDEDDSLSWASGGTTWMGSWPLHINKVAAMRTLFCFYRDTIDVRPIARDRRGDFLNAATCAYMALGSVEQTSTPVRA